MSLRGLTTAPITIYPYASITGDGTISYSAGVSYYARVSHKKTFIRNAQGQQIVSSGRLYVSGDISNINAEDKITMPDGTTVFMKDYSKVYDKYANVLYTVVYL